MSKNIVQPILITILLIISTFNVNAQDRPFITIWQTDNLGVTADNQIEIPGIGNYTIEWEEVGNNSNIGSDTASGFKTLTFPTAGTYRVKLNGGLEYISFKNGQDRAKIIDVEQWGDIQWITMNSAFQNCNNLNFTTTEAPNLSLVTDLSNMFVGADNFNSPINHWDVSNIQNMNFMFFDCKSFNQPLNSWNVSNALKMEGMFAYATSFNQDIGPWNVSNVQIMTSMFYGAEKFNQPLNDWNVSNVKNMKNMFFGAKEFNQPLNEWIVSNVTDMSLMFYFALNFDQPLGNWDVSKVTNMKNMFSLASKFNQNLGGWKIGGLQPDGFDNLIEGTALSVENYDSTLIGWYENSELPNNVIQEVQGLTYCTSDSIRNLFKNEKSWDFNGDQKDCIIEFEELSPSGSRLSVSSEIYVLFKEPISLIQENVELGKFSISTESSVLDINKISIVNDSLFISIDSLLPYLSNIFIKIDSQVVRNDHGLYNDAIMWSFRTEEAPVVSNKKASTFKGLKIYPNPFTESTNIQFELMKSQKAEWLIYDTKGSIVRQKNNLYLQAGSNTINVERDILPIGLYTFILMSPEGEIQAKIIIK